MPRRRVLLLSLAVVLAVAVLAGVATVAWHYARPSLPPLGAVEASTDAGIVAVVHAAGDSAAVTVTVPVPTASCQKTPFAHGHIYTRTANLYTDAGTEDALIGRIAAGLPAGFHASRSNPLGFLVAPLHAQPGPGVHLVVQVISAGWISATAQTDCRAASGSGSTRTGSAATAPSQVDDLFTALGTSATSWRTESVPCGGGAITTLDASSVATGSADIATRLAAVVPAGARRFTTPGNRIVWRAGAESTLVAASDDGTHITAQITMTTC